MAWPPCLRTTTHRPTTWKPKSILPLCRLRPGESCNLDTEWFPTRVGSEFHGVTEAGLVASPLRASLLASGKIKLSGSFGVFFAGKLVAHFYDEHGASLGSAPVANADPVELVTLETEIAPPGKPGRVSASSGRFERFGPRRSWGSPGRTGGGSLMIAEAYQLG